MKNLRTILWVIPSFHVCKGNNKILFICLVEAQLESPAYNKEKIFYFSHFKCVRKYTTDGLFSNLINN